MIVDKLSNASKYYAMHPLFKKAFEYLQQEDLMNLSVGRIDLEGDDLYLSIQEVNGKDEEEAVLESHRTYIDIQLPLTAQERFGWKALSDCLQVVKPYDEENDYMLWKDTSDTTFSVTPGRFVIFFPEDPHAPCIGNSSWKKIVMKVRV